MGELTVATGLFLLSASLFAGFVDSIAGGGGLIQLPALLIGLPKTETVTVLGTNKLGSVFGTSVAAGLYRRQIKPEPKVLIAMALPAFIGSAAGASLASQIPTSSMRPIVLILLSVVAIYTWLKPDLGKVELLRHHSARRVQIAALAGALIGFYDGIFGPGTGSFLMLKGSFLHCNFNHSKKMEPFRYILDQLFSITISICRNVRNCHLLTNKN